MAKFMPQFLAQIRFIAGAVALAFMVATVAPVSAQQPNSVNPTASSVHEQQLLKELNKIDGRGTIPVPSRSSAPSCSWSSFIWSAVPCGSRAGAPESRSCALRCSSASCTG